MNFTAGPSPNSISGLEVIKNRLSIFRNRISAIFRSGTGSQENVSFLPCVIWCMVYGEKKPFLPLVQKNGCEI